MILLLTVPLDESSKELLESIYLKYRDSMFAAALSITHNTTDAEDVVQHVFLKIAQKYMASVERLSDSKALRYYLLTATKHSVLNLYRTKFHEIPVEPVTFDSYIQDSVFLDQMNTYDSPILIKKIRNLKPIYRDVLYQRFVLDLSVKEIANINHAPLGTIKKRLLRAKSLLRTQLKETIHG